MRRACATKTLILFALLVCKTPAARFAGSFEQRVDLLIGTQAMRVPITWDIDVSFDGLNATFHSLTSRPVNGSFPFDAVTSFDITGISVPEISNLTVPLSGGSTTIFYAEFPANIFSNVLLEGTWRSPVFTTPINEWFFESLNSAQNSVVFTVGSDYPNSIEIGGQAGGFFRRYICCYDSIPENIEVQPGISISAIVLNNITSPPPIILYSSSATLPCDFDGDGDCDVADIDDLYSAYIGADGTNADSKFDLNGDGMASQLDVDPWLISASDASNPFKMNPNDVYLFGDVNFDGKRNSIDLGTLLNNFTVSGVGWSGGDFGFGEVQSGSLGLLLNFFGSSVPVSAVPEPDSTPLLIVAMLGFRLIGRRQRRNTH